MSDKITEQMKKRKEIASQHTDAIILEKHKLSIDDFPIANRLLDTELKSTMENGMAAFDDRYIDVYNEKPIKVQSRVLFPTKDVPTFNFVGKLLGPKGQTLKHLQETTKCKMFIFGRGSMRDKKKEEELRQTTDPKYAHLSDELHVDVSCVAPPAEAYSRIAYALSQLRLVLVPDGPGEGFFPYEEGKFDGRRSGGGRIPPLVDSKTKVMGFLEKARHSMEFQPPGPPGRRNFGGPPRGGDYYDYEEAPTFHRRGDEGYGPRGNGGNYFPPRAAPYARY